MKPVSNVHVLYPGHFNNGQEDFEVTDQLITDLVETYDPAYHEAPVCAGHRHPAPGELAWGAILGARRDDTGDLYLDMEVNDSVAKQLKTGELRKRSLSYYLPDAKNNPTPGRYHLRHLGLLGAEVPVVKGLKTLTVEFSEFNEQEGTVTMTIDNENRVASVDSVAALTAAVELAEKNAMTEDTAELAVKPAEVKKVEAEDAKAGATAAKASEDIAKADGAKTEDAKVKYIDSNINKWLQFMIRTGVKGFKGKITGFDPAPTQANNWLKQDKGGFAGAFMDNADRTYDFTITPDGETFTRSYKIRSKGKDAVNMGEYADCEGGCTGMHDFDQVEAMLAQLEQEEARREMLEAGADAVEDKIESLASLASTMEDQAEQAEDRVDELKDAAIEALRVKLAATEQALRERDAQARYSQVAQYTQFAESLYENGQLIDAQVPQQAVVDLLVTLADGGAVQFSEATEVAPAEFLVGLLKQIPPVVEFAEVAKGEKEDELMESDKSGSFAGTPDKEQLAVHRKALAYCKKHGLDPAKMADYTKALKTISSQG